MITKRYGVTAAHCLDGIAQEDQTLDLANSRSNERFRALVRHVQHQQDLALIELLDPAPIEPPPLGRCEEGDAWNSSYKPQPGDVLIGGNVRSCDLDYELYNGNPIIALQLIEEGRIGGYAGYSGGPVEVDGGQEGHRVVGVVLEQHEDRSGSNARVGLATGVLVAARIDQVYDFPQFEDAILRILVPPSSPSNIQSADRLRRYDESATHANSALEALRKMADSGALPASDFTVASARIRDDLRRSLGMACEDEGTCSK